MSKRLITAAAGVTIALAAAVPAGSAFARTPTRGPVGLAVFCASELQIYNAYEAQEAKDTGNTANTLVDEALASRAAAKYNAAGCATVTGVTLTDPV